MLTDWLNEEHFQQGAHTLFTGQREREKEREREREREKERERKREREREREKEERERMRKSEWVCERDVEYVQNFYFYF